MKKIALVVLAAMVAASPAVAKKKSKKMAKEPTAWERNEAGFRLVRDSLPIYLPTWAMPLYMSTQKHAAEPKKRSKRK
jgi:hypothetical protein